VLPENAVQVLVIVLTNSDYNPKKKKEEYLGLQNKNVAA